MQVDAELRRYSAATGPGSVFGSAAAAAAAGAVILDAMTSPAGGFSVAAPPQPANVTPTEPKSTTASGSWSSETVERGW
jgi:hypothetical protein